MKDYYAILVTNTFAENNYMALYAKKLLTFKVSNYIIL